MVPMVPPRSGYIDDWDSSWNNEMDVSAPKLEVPNMFGLMAQKPNVLLLRESNGYPLWHDNRRKGRQTLDGGRLHLGALTIIPPLFVKPFLNVWWIWDGMQAARWLCNLASDHQWASWFGQASNQDSLISMLIQAWKANGLPLFWKIYNPSHWIGRWQSCFAKW